MTDHVRAWDGSKQKSKGEVSEIVGSDADTQLGVWITDATSEGAFGLVMQDGGGYSSLFFMPSDWDRTKAKIDALIVQNELRAKEKKVRAEAEQRAKDKPKKNG